MDIKRGKEYFIISVVFSCEKEKEKVEDFPIRKKDGNKTPNSTMTVEKIIFNAGGGIVSDSEPIEEYVESLHKANHLVSFFGNTSGACFLAHTHWCDACFNLCAFFCCLFYYCICNFDVDFSGNLDIGTVCFHNCDVFSECFYECGIVAYFCFIHFIKVFIGFF